MRIAIVGCGFVADLYMKTLKLHPQLQLVGVTDRDGTRLSRFCAFHQAPPFNSLDELLAKSNADVILNLTNPRSHFAVSKQCLEAGKHVYSEKPLSMEIDEAKQLVALAKSKTLQLSSAPCSLLSETAQTIGKALRENRIGQVYAVYAEMDDGLLHRMPYRKWQSDSGTPWPWKDELEVGCTLEHAGYVLTWLCGYFGPADSVTAFGSISVPDKQTDSPLEYDAPDLTMAAIKFKNGVSARLTCSIVAPHDHRMLVVGHDGILWTPDTWHYRSPVYVRKYINIRRRMILNPLRKKLPMLGKENPMPKYRGASHMDFCRGVAEMSAAIEQNRSPRLGADFSLHVNEVALAIHHAGENGSTYKTTTTFTPPDPMPWAR